MIVAVTGHQPHLLGGYGPDVSEALLAMARRWIAANRPAEIVSGMAAGWDMAMAEAAVYEKVPLVAALAFPGQGQQWPGEALALLTKILAEASAVHLVSDRRRADMWAVRDRWVIDRAGCIVALWSGADGGTADAVAYALSAGKRVDNLWQEWEDSPSVIS